MRNKTKAEKNIKAGTHLRTNEGGYYRVPHSKIFYSPTIIFLIVIIILVVNIIISALFVSADYETDLILGLFYNVIISTLIAEIYIIILLKKRNNKKGNDNIVESLMKQVASSTKQNDEKGFQTGTVVERIQRAVEKRSTTSNIINEVKISLKYVIIGILLADTVISLIIMNLLIENQWLFYLMGNIHISMIIIVILFVVMFSIKAKMTGVLGSLTESFSK